MVVEVKNLGKRFGSVVAVVDVSFEVENGIFVLIGPNGAGKTTTEMSLWRDNTGYRRDQYLRERSKGSERENSSSERG